MGLTGPRSGAVPAPPAPPPHPRRQPPRFKFSPRPRAPSSPAAGASQELPLEGLEGSEVIPVPGHSATRCATTWEKSFHLCRGASQCPPAEQRPAVWHSLSFLSPEVAPPLPGSLPYNPSLKPLLSSLRRLSRENILGASGEGGPGSFSGPGVGGAKDKCPEEGAGDAERVARSRRTALRPHPGYDWRNHSAASTPSRANSGGPQPTPRGRPPPRPRPPSLPTPGSPPPPVRRPGRPSAHALGSRARPAPSLLLSTHSTTGEGAGEEGARQAT